MRDHDAPAKTSLNRLSAISYQQEQIAEMLAMGFNPIASCCSVVATDPASANADCDNG